MHEVEYDNPGIKFLSKKSPLQCQLFSLFLILNLSSICTAFLTSLPPASAIPSNLSCHSRFLSVSGLQCPSPPYPLLFSVTSSTWSVTSATATYTYVSTTNHSTTPASLLPCTVSSQKSQYSSFPLPYTQ